MIVTVTPNIALDITYRVDRFELNTSTRVTEVSERAGGKGINVARVLHTLGEPTVAVGLVGGVVGAAISADLQRSGVPCELGELAGQSRRSVAIVDTSVGDATVLNEAGPVTSPDDWNTLRRRLAALLPKASALVISGSLPPGVPDTAVGALAKLGREADVPTIVDTSGTPLLHAVEMGEPTLVKPNINELADALQTTDPVAGALTLIERGACAVAVSMGPDGMALITENRRLRAKPPAFIKGNPTGAGDAGVAAFAAGLHNQRDWADCLRDAVALSAAAVAHPLAGSFDAEVYRTLLETVVVEEI